MTRGEHLEPNEEAKSLQEVFARLDGVPPPFDTPPVPELGKSPSESPAEPPAEENGQD